MADGGEAEAASLQFTPTWIMAAVGSILVLVSLAAERGLHQLGKTLRKKNQKSLYEALLKIKEELMILGFIPLLLAGFQGKIPEDMHSSRLDRSHAAVPEGGSEDRQGGRQKRAFRCRRDPWGDREAAA